MHLQMFACSLQTVRNISMHAERRLGPHQKPGLGDSERSKGLRDSLKSNKPWFMKRSESLPFMQNITAVRHHGNSKREF